MITFNCRSRVLYSTSEVTGLDYRVNIIASPETQAIDMKKPKHKLSKKDRTNESCWKIEVLEIDSVHPMITSKTLRKQFILIEILPRKPFGAAITHVLPL